MGRIADLIPVETGKYLPVRCSGCGSTVVYRGEGSFQWGIDSARHIIVAHNSCPMNWQTKHTLDVVVANQPRKSYNPIRRAKSGAKISPGVPPVTVVSKCSHISDYGDTCIHPFNHDGDHVYVDKWENEQQELELEPVRTSSRLFTAPLGEEIDE